MSATPHSVQPTADEHVEAWLDQFIGPDRQAARSLLDRVKQVSATEFEGKLFSALQQRVIAGPRPVGLYVEREWGHRHGKAHRLFTEPNTKRNRRATGTGPRPVAPRNTVNPLVGSEGVVGTIVSGLAKVDPDNAFFSPGPDRIRPLTAGADGVRRFILVTDFIGSGNRAYRFLDAAWNVRSVRSWWSSRPSKGWSFEVVAFAATEAGLERLRGHPCKPIVTVCEGCPSIRTSFVGSDLRSIERLCTRYDPTPPKDHPFGYGRTGALIAFAHGMPNNAPTIFHSKARSWSPLYPKRVTSGRQPDAERAKVVRQQLLDDADERLVRSPTFRAAPKELRDALHVLSATARGAGGPLDIAARADLSIAEVQDGLDRARCYSWLDQDGQVTQRGRSELSRVRRASSRAKRLSSRPTTEYVPKQLRVPFVT